MTRASIYWHTLRHLKLIQFYGRFWFRVYRPKPDLHPAPGLIESPGGWSLPSQRRACMLGSATFQFLNEAHTLDDVGWEGRGLEKLWLYNLHYFDDLNARDGHLRRDWHVALLKSWVADNPPAVGSGWEPYPTSLRIVNWVKWHLAGNALPDVCVQSLATQVRWLSRRLERHLLGNHLFANAKALVFAGLLFQGSEAAAFVEKGLSIINRQLPEQVLPDGGNFERSTMYHSIFLEDVLDLINIAQAHSDRIDAEVVKGWRETGGRMLHWMMGMLHPDGQIGLFNDAAFDVAPEPAELIAYAKRLGIEHGSPHNVPPPDDERARDAYHPDVITGEARQSMLSLLQFPESGYVRLEQDNAVALLDVAPVGPDYLPGHAHADTLSFELSLFGQRIVVNGGTSRYGLGPERHRERQTVSHSTVEIAGQSSSEVWGGFRVARRAYPFDLEIARHVESLSVACSHDGYTRLSGKPIHRREWLMDSEGLMVTDRVVGGQHPAVARYILHPDVEATKAAENEWVLVLPRGASVRIMVFTGRAKLERANYAPEFGKVLPTQCLAVDLAEGFARTQFIWH